MFNKIACLSTHEVGFLFSTSGSPKVTPTPAACTGPRLSGRAPRLPPAGMFCPLLLTSPLTSTLPGAPSPASSFSPHSRLVRCRVSYSFVRRACFDCRLRAKSTVRGGKSCSSTSSKPQCSAEDREDVRSLTARSEGRKCVRFQHKGGRLAGLGRLRRGQRQQEQRGRPQR